MLVFAGGLEAGTGEQLQLLRVQAAPLESLAQCMQQSWMCILVGPPGAGKSLHARNPEAAAESHP